MMLFVTGAAGFLGRYVVADALRRGHSVRALVRPTSDLSPIEWLGDPGVQLARGDLRSPASFTPVSGVNAVIHLAATKHGDLAAQLEGTVAATKNLLDAMLAGQVARLVLVSTLSVYDYRKLRSFERLDESSPLEGRPEHRESYCRSKLQQEELVRSYTSRHGLSTTILRPGVVIGPGQTWTSQIGVQVSERLWLCFSAAGMPMQMTYVENCASAILDCTESEAAVGETLNVVDDELPTRRRYVSELRSRMPKRPRVILVPGLLVRIVARMIAIFGSLVPLRGIALPWFAHPATLLVQLKPLRFSNERIARVVGWKPRYGLRESLDRCFPRTRD